MLPVFGIQEEFTQKYASTNSTENRNSPTIEELHPHIEDEAQVYSQAMIALQINYMHRAYSNDIDNYYVDNVVTSGLLHFLHLDNDLETRNYISKNWRS